VRQSRVLSNKSYKLVRQRAKLANIDVTIRMFAPKRKPDTIPPKRTYRWTRLGSWASWRSLLRKLTRSEARFSSNHVNGTETASGGQMQYCGLVG